MGILSGSEQTGLAEPRRKRKVSSIDNSTTTTVRSAHPVGLFRLVGAVLLAMGAALGSFAFFAGSAGAATGPDTVTGSAFGASIGGPVPALPPTPPGTLPASGTAPSTALAAPLNPVLTGATL